MVKRENCCHIIISANGLLLLSLGTGILPLGTGITMSEAILAFKLTRLKEQRMC